MTDGTTQPCYECGHPKGVHGEQFDLCLFSGASCHCSGFHPVLTCVVCGGRVRRIWVPGIPWEHKVEPADGHDAAPKPEQARAILEKEMKKR